MSIGGRHIGSNQRINEPAPLIRACVPTIMTYKYCEQKDRENHAFHKLFCKKLLSFQHVLLTLPNKRNKIDNNH